MFIIMPSDLTTYKASEFLRSIGIKHRVLNIPKELGYKTAANVGIYLEGEKGEEVIEQLSAKGFVIMRLFKSFEIC